MVSTGIVNMNIMKNLSFVALLATSTIILSGCDHGLDRNLDFSSEAKLKSSLANIDSDSKPEEKSIFQEHLPNEIASRLISSDNQQQKSVPARALLVALLDKKISLSEIELSDLQKEKESEIASLTTQLENAKKDNDENQKIMGWLEQIKITDLTHKIVNNFFTGTAYELSFKVNNGSPINLSHIKVNATLSEEGSSDTLADSTVFVNFSDGLAAGKTAKVSVNPGGAFGHEGGWDKLSVRKASNPIIKVNLWSVTDFNNGTSTVSDGFMSSIKVNSLEIKLKESEEHYQQQITSLQTTLETLKQQKAIVEKSEKPLAKVDDNLIVALLTEPIQAVAPEPSENTSSTSTQRNFTSCTNQCVNGNCLRTFPDGSQERWQAPRKYDPFSGDWKWDTSGCGN